MKHQSAWDTFAAPVLFRSPAMVIKRELGWIPFYGWYALKAGMIPIDRVGRRRPCKRMVAAGKARAGPGPADPDFSRRHAHRARRAVCPTSPASPRSIASSASPLVPVAVNSGLFWGRRAFPEAPGADRRRDFAGDPARRRSARGHGRARSADRGRDGASGRGEPEARPLLRISLSEQLRIPPSRVDKAVERCENGDNCSELLSAKGLRASGR